MDDYIYGSDTFQLVDYIYGNDSFQLVDGLLLDSMGVDHC